MLIKFPRSTIFPLLLLLSLGLLITEAAQIATNDNLDIQLIASEDLQRLLAKNTNARVLAPRFTTRNKGRSTNTREYRLGDRVDGDVLVVHKTHNYVFQSPQNISVKGNYPSAGSNNQAATVSLVDIFVSQSSSLGNAYILNGGIGEQNIEFVIVANNTELIKYDISIYGYY